MSEQRLIRVRDVMKPHFDLVDGMVLLSDIARQVLALDRAPERVNIYEIMTKPVLTVSPGMDIRYCARLLSRFDLPRAPVVEHGEVIGIVSHTDLVLKGLRQQSVPQ